MEGEVCKSQSRVVNENESQSLLGEVWNQGISKGVNIYVIEVQGYERKSRDENVIKQWNWVSKC